MPPSHAFFFWKTCMTTRGWRPSWSNVARAWLKYASLYQPARIFSTGRSKSAGSRRVLVLLVAMLEREARGERGLRDLQLLRRRLGGREPMLQLVTGLRQPLREQVVGMTRHPAEELRRRGERAELRGGACRLLQPLGREAGERVADRGRREQRADEMSAAALVLLRRTVAVLVPADRDVLRAVIVRELAAAQREHGRCEGKERYEQLLRGRPKTLALAHALHGHARARDRREHAAVLHWQLRGRQRPLHLRQERHRLEQPRRPAEQRIAHLGRNQPLAPRDDLDLAVGVA